jgi:DNA invertase Pin-like site-specific DNA recombinase
MPSATQRVILPGCLAPPKPRQALRAWRGRLEVGFLGGLADVERDLIRTRTLEGRARARVRGAKLGPKFKISPEERKEAIARRAAEEASTAIGWTYEISHTTILRLRPRMDVPIPVLVRASCHLKNL